MTISFGPNSMLAKHPDLAKKQTPPMSVRHYKRERNNRITVCCIFQNVNDMEQGEPLKCMQYTSTAIRLDI